jgi:drug/metabolite transporter (DMT)-like permease
LLSRTLAASLQHEVIMSTLIRIEPAIIPTAAPKLSPETLGIALGIVAAVIWGTYLAMARAGVSTGLGSADIAFIRSSVAGLIMAPWLLWHQPLRLAGVGWRRAIVLACLAGPLFVLIGAGGFQFAPLAHGAVLQPAAITIGGTIAASTMFGERLTAARIVGITTILIGLVVIAGPGLLFGGASTPVGDAMFVTAGLMWAAFSILSKRWAVGPLAATAVVSVLSAAVYAPGYLVINGLDRLLALPANTLLAQVLIQGVLSGVVAVIAFSRAVQLLGPGHAAVFPAMVPAAAIILGVPIAGEWPTALQFSGLATVTFGLLIAIGALRDFGWRK